MDVLDLFARSQIIQYVVDKIQQRAQEALTKNLNLDAKITMRWSFDIGSMRTGLVVMVAMNFPLGLCCGTSRAASHAELCPEPDAIHAERGLSLRHWS